MVISHNMTHNIKINLRDRNYSVNNHKSVKLKMSFLANLKQDSVYYNFSGLVSKPTTYFITREDWHQVYEKQIMYMYDIIADIVDQRYVHKIEWRNNDRVLETLSKLLFRTSSKYVSPYVLDEC
jgi:hypothetical protein